MKQYIAELKIEGLSLKVGESKRDLVCPFCDKSSKGSILTRTDTGLIYHCFHAGCRANDTLFIDSVADTHERKERAFIPKPYTDAVEKLGLNERQFLKHEFGLDAKTLAQFDVGYNFSRDTYVYPIFTVEGYQAGVMDRDYSGTRQPKTLTYWYNDVPKLAFSVPPNDSHTVVVVEDQVSQMVISQLFPSLRVVALLGTHLSYDKAFTLFKNEYTDVIMWLDGDTWRKSNVPLPIKYKKEFAYMFSTWYNVYTEKDPKNLLHDEIKEIINGIIG